MKKLFLFLILILLSISAFAQYTINNAETVGSIEPGINDGGEPAIDTSILDEYNCEGFFLFIGETYKLKVKNYNSDYIYQFTRVATDLDSWSVDSNGLVSHLEFDSGFCLVTLRVKTKDNKLISESECYFKGTNIGGWYKTYDLNNNYYFIGYPTNLKPYIRYDYSQNLYYPYFNSFSSSDTSIATIDENGLITPKKVGKFTIKTSIIYGLDLECEVFEPTKSITVNLPEELVLLPGEYKTYTNVVNMTPRVYEDCWFLDGKFDLAKDGDYIYGGCHFIQNEKLTIWSTYDSLDERKLILKGEALGSSYIQVSDRYYAYPKSINNPISYVYPGKICDRKIKVTVINPIDDNCNLKVGESKKVLKDDILTNSSFTYKVNDSSIASIDKNGNVKGLKKGKTQLVVTNSKAEYEKSCDIIVYNEPAQNIKIITYKSPLNFEEEFKFEASYSPSNADKDTVIWKSTNTDVLTIDQDGNAVAVDQGSATIEVYDVNDKKWDSVDVVVYPIVEINRTRLDLNLGREKELKATVKYKDYEGSNINWYTDDSSIATVDSNGKVTAKKLGNTIIYAKAKVNSEVYKICAVYVTDDEIIDVESVSLNKTELKLEINTSEKLKATVLPKDATNKNVQWYSDNPKNVSVDENGYVTGLKEGGSATITAKTDDGDYKATCKVTVIPTIIHVVEVKLDKTSANIILGESLTLTATVLPENATDKTVTWTSSNSKVATVKDGVVTTLTEGKTTIKAISNDNNSIYGSCSINVAKINVKLDKNSLTIYTGNSANLKATVTPDFLTNKDVEWESNNNSIATVTNGVVKGIKAGSTSIKAISKYDGKIYDICNVTVEDPVIKVTGVKLDKTSITLDKGKTAKLTATVLPTNATNKAVTWKSNNTKVATVTNGVVKAVDGGTTVITVKTVDGGYTATCKVTVNVPETSVKVSPTTLSLDTGKTYTLKATVYPTNATVKTVTWTTSNSKIATVTSKGLVKGIKAGTVTITATSNNGKKGTCKVTVKQPVTSVKVSPTSLSLYVGKTSKLTATVLPTNATVKTVTWKSSNTKIATVTSSGVVKGIKAGTVTITVSSNNGKKATCKVTVKQPVTSVKLSKTSLSLAKGKTAQLTATVYPTNATNKAVTWKSSNTKIATVSSKGLVKAVAKGTATITVTTTDGKKTAKCKVTVK